MIDLGKRGTVGHFYQLYQHASKPCAEALIRVQGLETGLDSWGKRRAELESVHVHAPRLEPS